MKKNSIIIFILLNTYTLLSETTSIFSPGFFEKRSVSCQQARRYAKNNILHGRYFACTYNDNPDVANFGQEGDIAILWQQYQACRNAFSETNIVLAGLSRGAATLFNFLGKKNPSNIGIIIAESPFACIDDVIEQNISQWHLDWIPGIKKVSLALMSLLYPTYTHDGPQPLQSIDYCKELPPVLITCSKQDTIIPYTSSVRLAKKLKEKGHEVYLLVFDKGKHGFLSYKEEFQQIANALYARYNLAHNKDLALHGTQKLESYKL